MKKSSHKGSAFWLQFVAEDFRNCRRTGACLLDVFVWCWVDYEPSFHVL